MGSNIARLAVSALIIIAACLLCGAAWGKDSEDQDITIPLQKNLRLLVQPTLMGLVSPSDPANYGEALLRVVEKKVGQLVVHYEIKERVSCNADGSHAYEWWEDDPTGKSATLTRFRRGNIDVKWPEGEGGIIDPLFWGDGDWVTASGLMWLARSAYLELKTSGSTAWRFAAGANIPDEVINRFMAGIDTLAPGDEGGHEAALMQLVDPAIRYPCLVNGEYVSLPALKAQDSLGLTELWILADPDNPLLLKINYTPQESGPEVDDPVVAVFNNGTGFAVTEINF